MNEKVPNKVGLNELIEYCAANPNKKFKLSNSNK